jgi:DNA-binding NtrC family response regulator
MKGRILAVDDELHMLRLLERVFAERTKHHLKTTNNSLEVTSLLENEPFDIIITDLRMPGLDGMEILRWVAKHDRSEQVIVITAFGSVESARDAVKLGAFDYINKPFKQEELLFSVDRALRFGAIKREFKQADQLFAVQPFEEAAQCFRSLYLKRLAAELEGNAAAVAEQSGLSREEVERLLTEDDGANL